MNKVLFFFLFFISYQGFTQKYAIIGKVTFPENRSNEKVEILLQEENRFTSLSESGTFRFDSLVPQQYTLSLFASGYQSLIKVIEVTDRNITLELILTPLQGKIGTITIIEEKDNYYGITRLKPVEGTAIYAGKKSEVIQLDDISANLATNNARQIYSKVAGLNIWESDGAGIQLGIGGRGLNPNRVSNFNTRQNGYDISADALGYPESYYSPPTEAIERIEIVRGAASLQYGTQFGGFINFKLRNAPEKKKLEFVFRQTIGSFGLFNSFNSLGGNIGKTKHYSYLQYKTGNGWRPNSGFDVVNFHSNWSHQINSKLRVSAEYTFMHYLAQQPGGLTDFQFEDDPQQSNRNRNWFKVNWNLFAAHLDYKLDEQTDVNLRAFGLVAGRDAVGILDRITRADLPNTERNLLSDQYKNFGIEARLLRRYSFLENTSIFLIGTRYYNGFTDRSQGNGSTSSTADFNYRNNSEPEDSKYEFPSQNLAFFTENIFYLNPKVTVTPGVRFEYISTNANGYYFERFIANNGDTLFNDRIVEERNNDRSFLLAGIGLSYKPNEAFEVYTNFSQNYRSINFNDMRIDNPNYQVDPNLQDEKGYSADLGIRGNKSNWFNYDVSLFLLSYQGRIGTTLKVDSVLFRPFRFRTNISDSRNIGLESFAEVNILALLGKTSKQKNLSVFSNFSFIQARYINSEEAAFKNNDVELVPQIIFKTGLSYRVKDFQISYQYSFTSEHFSDATNANFSANAVFGTIPAYSIMDLSAKYIYKKKWTLESGINNLLDERYFTRRASGYPGPGIIPSDARNFYLTVGMKL
ncbi:MAG: TonB-dependent receptor [Flavobacteriales bacterium]|nr:TonB-dependent receptor [Flavobacteriales bacterium]